MGNHSITVSKVTTETDLDAVSNIRYRSYVSVGLIDKNPTEMFADKYENSLGAQTYAVSLNGVIVSSIRLHTLSKKHAISATYDAFTDHLKPLIDSGNVIVDGARFVVDPDLKSNRLKVARVTLDIAATAARQANANFGVAAIQETHTRFYETAGNFKKASEARMYGGLKKPFMLVMVRFDSKSG